MTVDAAALDARIPRLLLQPLVENAFEHGLRSGRGHIDVRVACSGGRLRLTVEDDGAGIAAPYEEGIGVANVRHRLALSYPNDHRFELGPRDGGGTRVAIDLPDRRDA